ncbi:related to C6 transcription factor [Cephalotrichum gorgonifer]|uniref:Related to C6 transcription factor n=1 Tax=Cephalotrichum gorgonifer TaxID=2041049 RepID=A0AAE8SZU3_9PEZI|nr:related to C6 transcription factor [Cephalotrichum gorgonifer]
MQHIRNSQRVSAYGTPRLAQAQRSASVLPTDGIPPSRASPDVDVAEIEGQYFDTTSGLAFLHRACKKLSTQRSDIIPHTPSASEKRQPLMTVGDRVFKVGAESLTIPDRDTALELMRFYFDECVVTYRIFHRQTVVAWLETLISNSQNGMPLTNELGHAKTAIVLGILAVVTFRQEKIRTATSQAFDEAAALAQSDPFFSAAMDLTDTETGLPKLESAQARLVQVLYLLQTSRMNQGWYVFGATSQITSALGLHRRACRKINTGKSSGQDYIKTQCQRRTFWVAYTIDKYLSVVFGRPKHYRDEDIDQEFPDCVNDEDMTPQGPSGMEPKEDCYVDAVIFHARLAQIIGATSRDVYAIKNIPKEERVAAAHRAIRDLRQWRKSLPPYLGTVRPSTLVPSFRRQATALRLAYSHAIIHAHRPFLLSNMSNSSGYTAIDSVGECISAAKVVLETVDGMAGEGTLFHAFWWTSYVTFCALAVVYVREIQQNTGGEETRDESWTELVELADACLSHLAKATSVDSPNRRYSVILEELRVEARRQASQPGSNPHTGGRETEGNEDSMEVTTDGREGVVPEWQQPLYGATQSRVNGGLSGQTGDGVFAMNNLLDGWQTSDWLDLDSSAFVAFTDLDGSPTSWIS